VTSHTKDIDQVIDTLV
jgi:hypothetical protein